MRSSLLVIMLSAGLLATPAARAETEAAGRMTESQARHLIEATGYTQVSGLRAEGPGRWLGRASRNGEPREISLDAEGNLHDAWEIAALTMFDRDTGEMLTPPPLVAQASR